MVRRSASTALTTPTPGTGGPFARTRRAVCPSSERVRSTYDPGGSSASLPTLLSIRMKASGATVNVFPATSAHVRPFRADVAGRHLIHRQADLGERPDRNRGELRRLALDGDERVWRDGEGLLAVPVLDGDGVLFGVDRRHGAAEVPPPIR